MTKIPPPLPSTQSTKHQKLATSSQCTARKTLNWRKKSKNYSKNSNSTSTPILNARSIERTNNMQGLLKNMSEVSPTWPRNSPRCIGYKCKKMQSNSRNVNCKPCAKNWGKSLQRKTDTARRCRKKSEILRNIGREICRQISKGSTSAIENWSSMWSNCKQRSNWNRSRL
jgi:hypothetical protein